MALTAFFVYFNVSAVPSPQKPGAYHPALPEGTEATLEAAANQLHAAATEHRIVVTKGCEGEVDGMMAMVAALTENLNATQLVEFEAGSEPELVQLTCVMDARQRALLALGLNARGVNAVSNFTNNENLENALVACLEAGQVPVLSGQQLAALSKGRLRETLLQVDACIDIN